MKAEVEDGEKYERRDNVEKVISGNAVPNESGAKQTNAKVDEEDKYMMINLPERVDDYAVPDPDGLSTIYRTTSNKGDRFPVITIRSFYLKIISSLFRCSSERKI